VDNGSRLKVSGEGGEGEKGGRPGDLYVILHIEAHSFFERHDDDIVCQIPISFPQAALGAEIEVPSLNGSKKLSIPPGAQSGQVFTLRGHGIQHLNGFGKGDQHVQIIVKIPTKLNKRQKELLKEFASLEGQEG
jgi:molecular chaperone DnaJ